MRRSVLALLLFPALGSCARTADTFKPRIVVTSPDGGGVTRARNITVKGYVLDDQGVAALTVDGKPLPLQAGSRKIAYFSFQTELSGSRRELKFSARDQAGNDAELALPIAVDNVPPAIKVTRFERERNVIRVTGVATDNTRVAEITVDGKRLNITPGRRADFYAETTGLYAEVQVRDGAGNETKLRASQ